MKFTNLERNDIIPTALAGVLLFAKNHGLGYINVFFFWFTVLNFLSGFFFILIYVFRIRYTHLSNMHI